MDLTTRLLTMGAAGAGGADKIYVEDVFSTWLYTGNGSTQTITNGIDLSGEGGLVWTKDRDNANNHQLFDTARGSSKILQSNLTNAQATDATSLTSFNSTGFSVGNSLSYLTNYAGVRYASWTFRKAPGFFDVVTYTSQSGVNQIAHNLGSVPGVIMIKKLNGNTSWTVYHRSTGATQRLELDDTGAAVSSNAFNNTAPTATHFYISPANNNTFGTVGDTFVAYLFAHDAGGFGDSGNDNVISCGSYNGNGSASGPTVTLGWEPQWLLVKRSDSTGDWILIDAMRGVSESANPYIYANTSAAEVEFSANLRLTATGFRLATSGSTLNASGGTYIYIAIRRGPMKTPTDATKVFKINTRTGTGSSTSITGIGFAPDLVAAKVRTTSDLNWGAYWYDRLRGNFRHLISSSTASEGGTTTGYALAGTAQETADIVNTAAINTSGDTLVDWFFRRAPGFFDVVAYTGTGVARTVSHNLGVAPELMIIKCRNVSGKFWAVYAASTGATKGLYLNDPSSQFTTSSYWNNSAPSSTAFTVGTDSEVNGGSNTYIAYLFATCPGVSKVGSYTGTGTTLSVDCGFTSGARFVLIKRTDSTGDWYVWDTARGIVAGNDPYLLLNSTAAEVTSTDYIDPLSSGFQISSTAPAAINANGGSFIFLAVA